MGPIEAYEDQLHGQKAQTHAVLLTYTLFQMRIARERGAHIQRLSALFKRLSTLTEVGPKCLAPLLKYECLSVKAPDALCQGVCDAQKAWQCTPHQAIPRTKWVVCQKVGSPVWLVQLTLL